MIGTLSFPPLVVVMGISGVGKTTVGRELAQRLGVEYADGDNFHPPANVAKMSSGIPLSDDDRWPWLHSIGAWLAEHDERGGVVSCSALRRAYRDLLVKAAPRAFFLHLVVDPHLIRERMRHREHFMPPSLLESQVRSLEPLQPDENGVMVDLTGTSRATGRGH